MDKVKVYLGYLGKYHFWLLCAVAVVLGVFGWMSARGSLSEEFAKNKSAVTGKVSTLEGIQNTPNPPNENWTTAITTLTKQEQEEVAATWNAVYEEQRKVLSWPEVMPSGFDRFASGPPTEEIPAVYLQAYQNEVLRAEFPKLAKIVDAAPLTEDAKPKTTGDGNGETKSVGPTYKVDWVDQEEVRKSLEFRSGGTPSSLEVRIRQEDYWVYQALLNIIRATNDAAAHVPYIKTIESIKIGAKAAALYAKGMEPGHIQKLASAGGEEMAAAPMDMAMSGGGAEEVPAPDEGRYLDKEGAVLPAGSSQDQQFKRLPVYLKLVMDQREITRLLTECANYPLPVEVRQLRILPSTGAANTSGRGGNAQGPSAPKPGEAYDVTVELNGIIYIFNPPDPAKLGTGTETVAAG